MNRGASEIECGARLPLGPAVRASKIEGGPRLPLGPAVRASKIEGGARLSLGPAVRASKIEGGARLSLEPAVRASKIECGARLPLEPAVRASKIECGARLPLGPAVRARAGVRRQPERDVALAGVQDAVQARAARQPRQQRRPQLRLADATGLAPPTCHHWSDLRLLRLFPPEHGATLKKAHEQDSLCGTLCKLAVKVEKVEKKQASGVH